MTSWITRRRFLVATPAAGLVPSLSFGSQPPVGMVSPAPTPSSSFPSHEPELVREMVGVSHGNVARVRQLVGLHPALAKASWDWGYGDWETALGAASHIGNAEIAEFLITHGAAPTIFSATMLGQLDVVKAFVAATPSAQRIRGPHGITLLAHARVGSTRAAAVAAYLESLGDADRRYADAPLSDAEQAGLVGTFAFGTAPTERLIVSKNERRALLITREGATTRGLLHIEAMTFHPVGAEAVRIRFKVEDGRATAITVEDGDLIVTAQRSSGR